MLRAVPGGSRRTPLLSAVRSLSRRALCAAGVLLLAACGAGETEPSAGFRVGLLTPGSVRDEGWNQSAYEGLMRIQARLGAQVAHQETHTPQEFEAGFRDFAARGFDLVFGHGFEFQDAAARVGGEYPGTIFVTTSGNTIRINVAPMVFELEQATYVLGHVGASISRRGRLGMVGGMEIPSVESTFMAFEAGARASRAQIKVSASYVGSWEDVSGAREATLALMSEGADVLIHNADAAARGFFQAVEESDDVLAFGTNRDQNHMGPGSVLASATLDIPQAFELVAREVKEGTFYARSIRFGLRDGVVGIAWNDALAERIPPDVRSDAERLVDEISTGRLQVPRGGF
jgi:basic membrane lipoprotein Med (substrate-binding protein (PBP1-ABC) superfamily)